jgi:Reverse transcriptase (RNA-dependent DNA polymerase)
MDESFRHFSDAKYFTLLDMKPGYWQIRLDEETKLETAFSTWYSYYHWNVLPFGLTNGVAGYQRRTNTVLAKYLDKFVLIYLDDVLVFSTTLEEHEEHVKAVLETPNEAGMILNLEKCQFFVTEVKFLGHIVSAEGIRPDPGNIAKVLEWPVPHMITDVRGFHNLANHQNCATGHHHFTFTKSSKNQLQINMIAGYSPRRLLENQHRRSLRKIRCTDHHYGAITKSSSEKSSRPQIATSKLKP